MEEATLLSPGLSSLSVTFHTYVVIMIYFLKSVAYLYFVYHYSTVTFRLNFKWQCVGYLLFQGVICSRINCRVVAMDLRAHGER